MPPTCKKGRWLWVVLAVFVGLLIVKRTLLDTPATPSAKFVIDLAALVRFGQFVDNATINRLIEA